MSAGRTKVGGAIEIAESSADVPTDPGVTLIRRNGGTLQQAIAGGSWSTLGSSGSASLASAIYNFAVSQYPTINRYKDTELDGVNSDYTFQAIGPNNATNTQTQAVKGGVTQIATNAAGSGGGRIQRTRETTPTPSSINAKTDVPWFCAAVFNYPSTVDANTQIALAYETVSFSAAITLGMNGAVSTTNYSLLVAAVDQANSAVALDLSGAYVLHMLGFDGTTLKGWITTPAGILTAPPTTPTVTQTVLTNVPTGASAGMISVFQGSAVASKIVRADYLFEAWVGAV